MGLVLSPFELSAALPQPGPQSDPHWAAFPKDHCTRTDPPVSGREVIRSEIGAIPGVDPAVLGGRALLLGRGVLGYKQPSQHLVLGDQPPCALSQLMAMGELGRSRVGLAREKPPIA